MGGFFTIPQVNTRDVSPRTMMKVYYFLKLRIDKSPSTNVEYHVVTIEKFIPTSESIYEIENNGKFMVDGLHISKYNINININNINNINNKCIKTSIVIGRQYLFNTYADAEAKLRLVELGELRPALYFLQEY